MQHTDGSWALPKHTKDLAEVLGIPVEQALFLENFHRASQNVRVYYAVPKIIQTPKGAKLFWQTYSDAKDIAELYASSR